MKKLNSMIRKSIWIFFAAYLSVLMGSCSDFLEVVPDNTVTMEDIFSTKEQAWNALSKVYHSLPLINSHLTGEYALGDEYRVYLENQINNRALADVINRGNQSVDNPLLGLWSGTGGVQSLYQGIFDTNLFMANIDAVGDMSETEKADWKAQAKFLHAYYTFLLVQHYGPVVIADKMTPADAADEDMYPRRKKVEECFQYIIRLIDEALPGLRERANADVYGQVDKVVAKSIKARILLFRASPLFNGNTDYSQFLDVDGGPFFPQIYDKQKWKDALDAVNEAIEICERNNLGLYRYDKNIYTYDREDYDANTENMSTLYDLRMLLVDAWNNETIWGFSNLNPAGVDDWQSITNIPLPEGYDSFGGSYDVNWCLGSSGATFAVAERYYTDNGLPIEEDLTYNYNARYDVATTPTMDDPRYGRTRGLLQPGAEVVNLYLNRELRFYANLGITGGYFRSHSNRIATSMFAEQPGGRYAKFGVQYITTGIGIQKFVHPDTKAGHAARLVRYPYPVIRMADLYLMKAEALVQYADMPTEEAYAAINKVRRRAGIPDVEEVWSDPRLARTVGKHTTKEGMLEIILRERDNELAFEGQRYWDVVRYKRAITEFSKANVGWNNQGTSAGTFFVRTVYQQNSFFRKNYLWPIDMRELTINDNLVQNPGW
ncbi:MAG TPA: RagB/SusD family nutrient uptake outer membrane protein [Parapedobacter sp.]|uniref:RagB/SusD family nutrient uptake outer membrane protein n=1 Tax=Parapedobacter sp. TaxID=1958893 RepID=UPI002B806C3A|nr:RagB/SusD family nutrient uptake outer membrane protein [Parapedobacter sp.]HWK59038.1 RagB/SusD family nutrient uptake outer membrane protein [Parapedobacter sp.]